MATRQSRILGFGIYLPGCGDFPSFWKNSMRVYQISDFLKNPLFSGFLQLDEFGRPASSFFKNSASSSGIDGDLTFKIFGQKMTKIETLTSRSFWSKWAKKSELKIQASSFTKFDFLKKSSFLGTANSHSGPYFFFSKIFKIFEKFFEK